MTSPAYCVCLLLLPLLLTACASLSATPQRLPTRATTPTPTPTPFSIPARTYYREGVARQETGDVEGALQSFTWAIQRAPDFLPAYIARGTLYLACDEPRLALADADAALEIDPTNATAHALRGEALRLLGRARQALEAFDRAVDLEPDLGPETFLTRWLAARAARDGDRLLAMSREYARCFTTLVCIEYASFESAMTYKVPFLSKNS